MTAEKLHHGEHPHVAKFLAVVEWLLERDVDVRACTIRVHADDCGGGVQVHADRSVLQAVIPDRRFDQPHGEDLLDEMTWRSWSNVGPIDTLLVSNCVGGR